jgi:VCBS repeat-containing protein
MRVREWTFVGLALLLVLALVVPVLGQEEGSSPATWLPGDDAIGLAAGLQLTPAVARGGDLLLAVWADHRSMPGGTGSFYETASDVYGMRLDGSGNPLDAVPFVITQAQASQENPQVVWNGSHWLVVFESYAVSAGGYYQKSLAAVRVAPSGQVVDAQPIPIHNVSPTGGNTWAAASDGTDWVVVFQTSDSNSSLKAVRITAAGAVAQPPKLLMPSTYYLRFNLRLSYAGGVYLFTWMDLSDTLALRFDGALNVLDASPITLLPGYSLAALASSGSQFYIAWHKTQPNFTIAVTGSRVDANGQKLEPDGVDISGDNQPQSDATTSISWEGANWRVTWGHNNGVRIARIGASGEVLDPGGVALTGLSTGPTAGTPSGGVQIVWGSYISAENDVYTANVSAGNSAGPTKGLSLGSPMQVRADAAVGANGSMVVYRSDISAVLRIMAQPLDANGAPIGTGPIQLDSGDTLYGPGIPSVAWNGSLYLVAWSNSSGIVARRVLQDGTPVDPTPVLVTSGFGPVDVAALGDLFLVVGLRYDSNPQWTYGVGARVRGSDGVVLDPAGLALAGSFARWASVTTLGSRWLAVWHLTWSHDDPMGSTVGSFVSADGTSPGEFSIYGPFSSGGGNGIFEVAVAGGSTQALALTSNEVTSGIETDLVANIVNADGSVQPAINLTPWLGNQYRPRVAWDGSQFVVVYNEQRSRFAPSTLDALDARSDLFGMRVTAGGTIVDPKGFAFSLSPAAEAHPNVAASGGVSLIVGSVVRNESPFAAYRVGYERFGVGGNQWPVAVASANTVGGDVPLVVAFSSAGSADPDGSISTYAWDLGDGATSSQPNPSHTYTVAGNYVATLTVTDNQAVQTVNTVPLAVSAPNQPPVAVATADLLSGPPPLDVTFKAEESYDPDGALGNVVWQFHDGSTQWGSTVYFSYQQAGVYQVTLTVWDDRNATGTDTITIYVGQPNHAPVAADDAYATPEDTPLPVPSVLGVLANDVDPDGDPLTAVLDTGPSHGTLELSADGSFTYTPAAGYAGLDTFTYHANDGQAGSNVATVDLTVTAANEAPVAADDAYTTQMGVPVVVAAPGVLLNDTDAENDPLTAVLDTGPSHGTLELSADGSFTYTPAAGYVGLDTFTYHANDGQADSSVATVQITVTGRRIYLPLVLRNG